MPKVSDIYNFIDSFAPFESQAEWDNSGLLVGDSDAEVKKAVVALDCTDGVTDLAVREKCSLIITHHPVIFNPQSDFRDDNTAYKCAKNGISVISAHTCYDFARGGVNDILAETLSLKNIRKSADGEFTLGETDCTEVKELAGLVAERLAARVSYCLKDKRIKTVAVCGGAGADFLAPASLEGADVLVTGEAKYHEFLDAAKSGTALITAGHYNTEVIAMRPLYQRLCERFGDIGFILYDGASPIEYI